MPIALLVTDLEGVAGVDDASALAHGALAHAQACRLLQVEVLAALEGLRRAGFDRVRLSDSHRSGSPVPHLAGSDLPPGVVLSWTEDAYQASLFDGVSALACLGMHAAAGTAGFAAHTFSTHCQWTLAGRNLSEADLLLGLAAERGVPVSFVSGDDVLGRSLPSSVRYVRTKRAVSWSRARSRSPAQVARELVKAAAAPPGPAPLLSRGPLEIRFKSAWQAALAGGLPNAAGRVRIRGKNLRERYDQGLAAVYAQGEAMGAALRGAPGSASFVEDAMASLSRAFPPPRLRSYRREAERALSAFLELTAAPDDERRALRALTLHMLAGHAPRFFRKLGLRSTFAAALDALGEVPLELAPSLDGDAVMARLDARYLQHAHGRPTPALSPEAVTAAANAALVREGPLHAWLFLELARAAGCEVENRFHPRGLRAVSRLADLYALTHLWLLDTGYLRRPLSRPGWRAEAEELTLAAGFVVRERLADLAGELAFCLQAAGEHGAAEPAQLLAFLARCQTRQGTLDDPRAPGAPLDVPHATATALLAFAGHEERR